MSDYPSIPAIDEAVQQAASERQAGLAKPPGALGRLEALSVRVAGMTGRLDYIPQRRAIVVCAGDHGVVAQGVTAYPQSVTALMVETFIAGRAAINAIAREVGAQVMVVDAGVAGRYATPPQATEVLVAAPIGRGTKDFTQGPAMTPEQAEGTVKLGLEVVERLISVQGVDLLAVGEMGIGNTTPATAIIAAITGEAPAAIAGRGAGVDDEGLARKIAAIEKGLALHAPVLEGTLYKVGGYEIGAMAGVMLGAAAQRVPVIIDGLISTAAALIAQQIDPAVVNYFIAGHRSEEPGHNAALAQLGLEPLLDFGMRLGEGSGAALAMPLVGAAMRALAEMATLDEVLGG